MGVDVSQGQNACPFWISDLTQPGSKKHDNPKSRNLPKSFLSQKGPTGFIKDFSTPKSLLQGSPDPRLCVTDCLPGPRPPCPQSRSDSAHCKPHENHLVASALLLQRGWDMQSSACLAPELPWAHRTAARILSLCQGWRKGTELPSTATAEVQHAERALHLTLLPTAPAGAQLWLRYSPNLTSCWTRDVHLLLASLSKKDALWFKKES